MIIDSSAVVAMLTHESRGTEVLNTLDRARSDGFPLRMSAATLVEVGVVVDRRQDTVLSRQLDGLLTTLEVEVVLFDRDQAIVARQAYRDFGKGSGHPARLNFGDCFSYALAATRREPLLFVGDDFGHTDVVAALD